MHHLGRSNAEQDPEDLQVTDTLRQGRVQAAAALLDHAEVERRCVGDRLHVLPRTEVVVAPRDRRMLSDG